MNLKPLKKVITLTAAATTLTAAMQARLDAEAVRASFCLPDYFTATAHAGSENTKPNTIESIKKAIEAGADVAEVDVTKRDDGTVVLLHAPSAGENEGLPLAEALEFVRSNSDTLKLNLDLKRFDIVEETEALVREYDLAPRCFFTGIGQKEAPAVAMMATIPYYINIKPSVLDRYNEEYYVSTASEVNMLGAIGVNCPYPLISKKGVEIMRKNSLRVSLYTADGESMLDYALTLLPDNISTNNPQILIKKLRRQ